MAEETLSALIRGVRDPNDARAWSDFYSFYQPLLRRYVRRLKVLPQDADDIVQDLFLKLHALMPTFQLDRGRGQFRGWLRRVTDHFVEDHFRGMAARRNRDKSFAEYHRAVAAALAATSTEEQERHRLWTATVSMLVMEQIRKEFQHRATTLACFEESLLKGRKAKDVALELGIENVNTVYVYASKVFKRVKELKQNYDGIEFDPASGDGSSETL